MKKILIIIALIVVAGTAYILLRQTGVFGPLKEPAQNNEQNQQPASQTNLKSYKNDQYSFEILYPEQYQFNEGGSIKYNVGEFFVGRGNNIATISLPENSYQGTNYFDAFLTISVSPSGVTEASCRQAQQEGNSQVIILADPIIINNVTFYRGLTNGAAAGTFVQNRIYHAFVVDKCFEITQNLFEGNIGNYPEGSVRQIDENDVFSKLEAVFKTLKITVPPPVQAQQNVITPEQFTKNYLDAYKNVATKNNFAQIKSFLSADALSFMQSENVPFETNYTNFDNYQIISVDNLGNHYVVKVKLFSGGQAIKDLESNDITEIDIIKQGTGYKAETWYFTQ